MIYLRVGPTVCKCGGPTPSLCCKPVYVSPPILLQSHPSPSLRQALSSPHHSSRPFKRLNISICFQYWLSDLTSQSSVIFMQIYISKNYTWLNFFTIHTICVSFSNNIKIIKWVSFFQPNNRQFCKISIEK